MFRQNCAEYKYRRIVLKLINNYPERDQCVVHYIYQQINSSAIILMIVQICLKVKKSSSELFQLLHIILLIYLTQRAKNFDR